MAILRADRDHRASLTADVNHAVFFSKGSTSRVGHPADCDDGTDADHADRVEAAKTYLASRLGARIHTIA